MMMHCIPMSGLIENPKLYSTIRVSLMEKEGGEVAEALYDYAACYEQDIAQAMKDFHTEQYPSTDLMQYFSLPNKRLETAIRSKVLSRPSNCPRRRKNPLRCFGTPDGEGPDSGRIYVFCQTNCPPI